MSNAYSAPSADLNSPTLPCRHCHAEISRIAVVCPKCGAAQRSRGYKSKIAAGALSLIIGGLGIHRFYLGQWWGIFYILLIWTGIPSLVSLIEAIVFFCADQRKWDLKHNEGRPAGPNEGSGGGVIVLIVVGVLGAIMVLGILAAVAIPAYQDYTIRAKSSEGLVQTIQVRQDFLNYLETNNRLPADNASLGYDTPKVLPTGDKVYVGNQGFELRFDRLEPQLDDKTFVFRLVDIDGTREWDCTGGTLENHYRPSMCRSN